MLQQRVAVPLTTTWESVTGLLRWVLGGPRFDVLFLSFYEDCRGGNGVDITVSLYFPVEVVKAARTEVRI